MPSHTKAEQEENKKKEKGGTMSAVGSMLQKLLPGGFGKSMLDDVNEKIKKELKKKQK